MSLKKTLSRLTKRGRQGRVLESALGMSSSEEREFLEDYTARVYSGVGTIVDLGSWLGSLTIPLLIGLDRNPAGNGAEVHAYDLFEWADWMNPWKVLQDGKQLKPGDSFLPAFLRQVLPHDTKKRLLIHAGDLPRLGWCGRRIELLVVDVMKNWTLANCVVQTYFPCLIAGKSYVFHQDFCHYFTPWIHLIHYRFRNHFEKVASLPNSGTVVFKYTRPFPEELLKHTYSFSDFSDAEIEAAFEFSLQQVDANLTGGRQTVMGAKIMAFVHQKRFEDARRELASLKAKGWAIDGELKTAAELANPQ